MRSWDDWDVDPSDTWPIPDVVVPEVLLDRDVIVINDEEEIEEDSWDVIADVDVPQSREKFSWLEEYPECIGEIEEQGNCGSCWAFTSSGLLADRFCIQSQGKINLRLSPQEMVDCNFENFACAGGYLMTTIDYL